MLFKIFPVIIKTANFAASCRNAGGSPAFNTKAENYNLLYRSIFLLFIKMTIQAKIILILLVAIYIALLVWCVHRAAQFGFWTAVLTIVACISLTPLVVFVIFRVIHETTGNF